MSNLLEQWNEYIIRGNQLSRELEDIEDLMDKAREADICFSSGNNGAIFIRVLSPEKMKELKESAMIAIMRIRNEKEMELQKLMGKQQVIPSFAQGGIVSGFVNTDSIHKGVVIPDQDIVSSGNRKPAIINPEFEAAVQGMVGSVKHKQTDVLPPPDDKSLDKYPAKKSKPSPYPENMTEEAVKELYINQGKTIQQVANHFGIPYAKANSFITGHKLHRNQQKPAETERP